jgi:hypothetical protein
MANIDKKLQWETVAETLQAALGLVEAMDEKPSVQYTLYKLIQTARAQAKLWRNPNVCKCTHGIDDHERMSGPCNVRTADKHCICYQFKFE